MRTSFRPALASLLALLSAAAVCTTTTGTAAAAGTASAIRINSGGGAVVDAAGRSWLADSFVTGGRTASVASVTSATPDVDRTERYGANTYAIPVNANLDYTLRLHLTEVWFRTTGPASSTSPSRAAPSPTTRTSWPPHRD